MVGTWEPGCEEIERQEETEKKLRGREKRRVKEIETSLTYKSLVILFPGLIFLSLIADS